MIHFVYMWMDPRTGTPFYVGIGIERRLIKKRRNVHTNRVRKKIESLGLQVEVRIVSKHKDREIAKRKEVALIKKYGRKHDGSGCLTNISPGGDGATFCGFSHTRRSRALISIANTRRCWSQESRSKLSASLSGKKRSPEAIEKWRAKVIGTKRGPISENVRKAVILSNQRRVLTPEARLKLSESQKRRWATIGLKR